MATPAQIAANQANAAHSTGPRTPEGKARVACNALRHGLTARHLVIRDDEREEFAVLQSSLLEELAPQGAAEIVTFHELVHAAWNLHRFRRLEAEASSDFADPQAAAYLDRLTRYQARSQRAWYRALAELRTLQTNRALRDWKVEPAAEPDIPAIADINELTKLTRSEVVAEGLKLAIKLVDIETRQHNIQIMREVKARQAAKLLQQPDREREAADLTSVQAA